MARSEALREEIRGRFIYWKLMLMGVLSISKLLITSAEGRETAAADQAHRRALRQASQMRYELPDLRRRDGVLPRQQALSAPHPLLQLPRARSDRAGARAGRVPEVRPRVRRSGLPLRQGDDDAGDRAHRCAVEATLERGTGTCFELITVFIALCRAAGIPARYKIFSANMVAGVARRDHRRRPAAAKVVRLVGLLPAGRRGRGAHRRGMGRGARRPDGRTAGSGRHPHQPVGRGRHRRVVLGAARYDYAARSAPVEDWYWGRSCCTRFHRLRWNG